MAVIDFRTYPVQVQELYEHSPDLRTPVHDIFGFYCSPQPLLTFIRQLDAAGVDKAVIATLDCTTAHGAAVVPNDALAHLVGQSDRLMGFASVDPNDSAAPAALEHAIETLGLKGLNLDPALQRFQPDGENALHVYEKADALGIPITFQMGMNWAPRARIADARPIDLEVAAATFPNLRIVVAHCGWPYTMEALALAIKYPNVFLDTAILFSGRPESSVAAIFAGQYGLEVVEASLRERIVFASDYPRVDPKRVARAVRMLGLRPITEKMIFGENARTLLKRKPNQ